MGIQINGQTDRISAVDGSFSIQDLAEVNVTGVATASNFKSGTSNVHSTGYECTNINATGIVTAASANFTGNVSVGGTLTYQDVTNIDSVGVVTARSDIHVLGSTLRIKDSGNSAQRGAIYGDASSFHINAGVNNLIAYSAGTERLRVTSGGNIGIGTDAPAVKLDIVDSGSPNIALRGSSYPSIRYSALDGTTDAEIYYGIGGNDLVLNNVNAGPISLKTSNTERLRITQNSNSSTTLTIGNGFNLNNNTAPDRTSVKVGGTLHLESSYTGSNHKTGMYYNCFASGQSNFYQGTFAASAQDYRAAAATLNHGALKVYTDPTTSTNYSAGSQITTMVETLRCANGFVTKPNQPAFSVRRNSSQDIPHNTNTKVQWNTEIFDVGGNFDSSTNFRFTAPVAGKYLFLGHLYIYSTMQVEAKIYKNGSIYKRFSGPKGTGGNDNPNGMDFMDIVDLSVNDFIEIFGYHYRDGDSSTVSIYGGNLKETSFVGYLLG